MFRTRVADTRAESLIPASVLGMLAHSADHPLLVDELSTRLRRLEQQLQPFSGDPFVKGTLPRLHARVRRAFDHLPQAKRGNVLSNDVVVQQLRQALAVCSELEAWLARQPPTPGTEVPAARSDTKGIAGALNITPAPPTLLTMVDRDWEEQGLARYSTPALFEALHRFGIPGGEEAFRNWAQVHFPAEMVTDVFHRYWNAAGAFASYHRAAAEELWQRLIGPTPEAMAWAAQSVLAALVDFPSLQAAKPPRDLFSAVDELRGAVARLPLGLQPRFPLAAYVSLGGIIPRLDFAFETIADNLMVAGHTRLSERVLELQAYFSPGRAAFSRSFVLWGQGDTEGAIALLAGLADDPYPVMDMAEDVIKRLVSLNALEQAQHTADAFIRAADAAGAGCTAADLRRSLFTVLLRRGNPDAVGFSPADAGVGAAPCVGPLWGYLRAWGTSPTDLLRFFNVAKPPVDVGSLAKRMDVTWRSAPLAGCSGRLELSADFQTAEITLNASESNARRNFTLAFLLGHLLHSPLERLRRRDGETNSWDPDNSRALDFASALLVPFWMLEPLLRTRGAPPDLRDLAHTFGVSPLAMKAAYDKLQDQIEDL